MFRVVQTIHNYTVTVDIACMCKTHSDHITADIAALTGMRRALKNPIAFFFG